ncbi:MAG: LacI family DNA-binding transcriptional regulator [Verrucomicrobia bacterium]|nr:LacI family DNA-binding transcriptional regulator [Verrucomicrobiota bacterium]
MNKSFHAQPARSGAAIAPNGIRMKPAERVFRFLESELERPGIQEGNRLPTIRELAGRLKVSTFTVQKVFQRLAGEGRIRVEVGNGAFFLASGRKADHAFITLGIPAPGAMSNDIWGQRICCGMLNMAARSGKGVRFLPLACWEREGRLDRSLLLNMVSQLDGLVLFPDADNDPVRLGYDRAGKPVVDLNPPSETSTANFVSPDYFGASVALGGAWRALGKKRVLFLTGAPLEASVSNRLRLAGLAAGLGQNPMGFLVGCRVIIADSVEEEGGRRAMQWILSRGKWVPDAVYCFGDLLALGAVKALREHGVKIPAETSVVGGTGLDLSTTTCPELTRTGQPFEKIGEELVGMLQQRIRCGGASAPGRFLPMSFIAGGTTSAKENELLVLQ